MKTERGRKGEKGEGYPLFLVTLRREPRDWKGGRGEIEQYQELRKGGMGTPSRVLCFHNSRELIEYRFHSKDQRSPLDNQSRCDRSPTSSTVGEPARDTVTRAQSI